MKTIDALIHGKFPDRRSFAKVTGIDEGQLSRMNNDGTIGVKTAVKMSPFLAMTPGQIIDFALQNQRSYLDKSA